MNTYEAFGFITGGTIAAIATVIFFVEVGKYALDWITDEDRHESVFEKFWEYIDDMGMWNDHPFMLFLWWMLMVACAIIAGLAWPIVLVACLAYAFMQSARYIVRLKKKVDKFTESKES